MVVMALDHTRDFFAAGGFNPRDVGDPALFLTRWVTHFCAPVFVFLAGTSAFLYGARGRTVREVSCFLFTRGLLLVLLEGTVVRFAWTFSLVPEFLVLQVIWAIGVSMIVLAGLIHLPRWAISAVGIGMMVGHNLLDGIQAAQLRPLGWLWHVLHQPALMHPSSEVAVFALYPLIPWIGVMAAGYALGPVMLLEPARRRRWLAGLGAGVAVAFVLLRATNIHLDPAPWAPHDSIGATALSFVNTEKYPPSTLYLAMTLGPALIALAAFELGAGQARVVLRPVRPSSPLLLHRAPTTPPYAGGGVRRRQPWRGRLVVWRLHQGQSGEQRAGPAWRVLGVDYRGSTALPAVPLVCGRQAPAQHGLVELSLILEADGSELISTNEHVAGKGRASGSGCHMGRSTYERSHRPIVAGPGFPAIAAIGTSLVVHESINSGPSYLHIHRSDDEAWHVLEGSLCFQFADGEVDAPAGTKIFVPAGRAGRAARQPWSAGWSSRQSASAWSSRCAKRTPARFTRSLMIGVAAAT